MASTAARIRAVRPAGQLPSAVPAASIELYWLPLGAGGWFVRLNGRLYETIHALLQHRQPLDLYHTALVVRVPEGRYVVENCWPIPDAEGRAGWPWTQSDRPPVGGRRDGGRALSWPTARPQALGQPMLPVRLRSAPHVPLAGELAFRCLSKKATMRRRVATAYAPSGAAARAIA